MQKELQQQLSNSFPWLKVPINCGNGWYSLLWEMGIKISDYLKKQNINNFKILKIEENFGSLKIQTSPSNKEIDNLINLVQENSNYICEYCGQQGIQYNFQGWVITVCDDCMRTL